MPAPLPFPGLALSGVAHALERRYLRKVFFGFSRDAAGKDLLEEVGAVRSAGCWQGCGLLHAYGCWQAVRKQASKPVHHC